MYFLFINYIWGFAPTPKQLNTKSWIQGMIYTNEGVLSFCLYSTLRTSHLQRHRRWFLSLTCLFVYIHKTHCNSRVSKQRCDEHLSVYIYCWFCTLVLFSVCLSEPKIVKNKSTYPTIRSVRLKFTYKSKLEHIKFIRWVFTTLRMKEIIFRNFIQMKRSAFMYICRLIVATRYAYDSYCHCHFDFEVMYMLTKD